MGPSWETVIARQQASTLILAALEWRAPRPAPISARVEASGRSSTMQLRKRPLAASMTVAPSCCAKSISSSSDKVSMGALAIQAKWLMSGASDLARMLPASPSMKIAPRFCSDMRKAQRSKRLSKRGS